VTGESLDDIMANFERDVINSALEQNHFNQARVADQLKITRHALRYRMQRLNISGGTDNNSDEVSPLEKGK
jgi:DNA-binding NtrC family response regulator